MSQDDSNHHHKNTSKLSAEQRLTLAIPGLGSFDMRFASRDIPYYPVPSNYTMVQDIIPWRVLIKIGEPAPRMTIGLDIYADIVLGRGAGSTDSPDIDLSNLDALDLGVSRRHSMIRPTRNRLYLIDLNSTNGSYVNAVPVGKGMAQVLRHGDTVSLSRLSFVIEIVSSPAISEGREISTRSALREEASDVFMTPVRRPEEDEREPQPGGGKVRLAPPSGIVGPATRPITDFQPGADEQDQSNTGKSSED
jgi:pSer/pThr/pTyr-binding forkhead associated (FHA) protein